MAPPPSEVELNAAVVRKALELGGRLLRRKDRLGDEQFIHVHATGVAIATDRISVVRIYSPGLAGLDFSVPREHIARWKRALQGVERVSLRKTKNDSVIESAAGLTLPGPCLPRPKTNLCAYPRQPNEGVVLVDSREMVRSMKPFLAGDNRRANVKLEPSQHRITLARDGDPDTSVAFEPTAVDVEAACFHTNVDRLRLLFQTQLKRTYFFVSTVLGPTGSRTVEAVLLRTVESYGLDSRGRLAKPAQDAQAVSVIRYCPGQVTKRPYPDAGGEA